MDTHFNYENTPYVTQFGAVSSLLIASGIRHIRDGGINATYANRLTILGQNGINHSMQFNVGVTAAQITSALAQNAPYVDFVESQNEYDDNAASDPSWAQELVSEQQLLYTTVRGDPANASVAVLGPALNRNYYSQLGNLDPISDFGNLHSYECSSNPQSSLIASSVAQLRVSTSKPVWTTETGYSDDTNRACGLSDNVIAKYDPRLIAERYIAGEPRTYLYAFSDDPTDPQFGALGLVSASGTAKPQYSSIAGMISMLADKGPEFSPKPLTYAIAGSKTNMDHLLLQKRNGTYILLLWLEVSGWSAPLSNIGGAPIGVAAQNVTLTLPGKTGVSAYGYTGSGTITQTPLTSSGAAYTVGVSDSITYIEFK